MILKVPKGSEDSLERSGSLGYLRFHREDLVTPNCIWVPQIGPEPASGRSEYPGYV